MYGVRSSESKTYESDVNRGLLLPQPILRKRAEPWRKAHPSKFFALRTRTGLTIAGYVVSDSLFWISYFACTETMASTGSRKSAAEMVTAGLWRVHLASQPCVVHRWNNGVRPYSGADEWANRGRLRDSNAPSQQD